VLPPKQDSEESKTDRDREILENASGKDVSISM
jgi:hypothetical protein